MLSLELVTLVLKWVSKYHDTKLMRRPPAKIRTGFDPDRPVGSSRVEFRRFGILDTNI